MKQSISNLIRDDRAAANALGYILLLGVVFISITAVVLLGGSAIDERESEAQLENSISGFDVASENIEQVGTGDVSTRSSRLPVQDGTVFPPGEQTIRVNVTADGNTETHVLASTPVSYTTGTEELHYETGAVIRVTGGVPSMRTQPSWVFNSDRVLLPVTRTTVRPSQQVITGDGSVRLKVTSEKPRTQAVTRASDPVNESVSVEVTVSSRQYEAWERFFEGVERGTVTVDDGSESVTLAYETDAVYLRDSVVTVESSS